MDRGFGIGRKDELLQLSLRTEFLLDPLPMRFLIEAPGLARVRHVSRVAMGQLDQC